MRKYCKAVMIGTLFLTFLFGCSNLEEAKENTRAITLEEFNGVTKGMELEEAIELIGGEGKIMGESGKKGTPSYQIDMVWDGETGNSFGQISFQNNKMMTKMQEGLQ